MTESAPSASALRRREKRRAAHVGSPCERCGNPIPFQARRYCGPTCAAAARVDGMTDWRQANAGRRYEYMRDWHESHPGYSRDYGRVNRPKQRPQKAAAQRRRRARLAQVRTFTITPRDLHRALIRAGNACAYCRAPFTGDTGVTWDHVVPLNRGGTDSIGNLLPACGRCNSRKRDRLLVEMRALGRF